MDITKNEENGDNPYYGNVVQLKGASSFVNALIHVGHPFYRIIGSGGCYRGVMWDSRTFQKKGEVKDLACVNNLIVLDQQLGIILACSRDKSIRSFRLLHEEPYFTEKKKVGTFSTLVQRILKTKSQNHEFLVFFAKETPEYTEYLGGLLQISLYSFNIKKTEITMIRNVTVTPDLLGKANWYCRPCLSKKHDNSFYVNCMDKRNRTKSIVVFINHQENNEKDRYLQTYLHSDITGSLNGLDVFINRRREEILVTASDPSDSVHFFQSSTGNHIVSIKLSESAKVVRSLTIISSKNDYFNYLLVGGNQGKIQMFDLNNQIQEKKSDIAKSMLVHDIKTDCHSNIYVIRKISSTETSFRFGIGSFDGIVALTDVKNVSMYSVDYTTSKEDEKERTDYMISEVDDYFCDDKTSLLTVKFLDDNLEINNLLKILFL